MDNSESRPPVDVTRLIENAQNGGMHASSVLLNLVYSELKMMARSAFRGQPINHTLQPTALVHEAWMKLAGNLDAIDGRRHFFAVAAKAMRHVLRDHARDARRLKRGGGQTTVFLNEDVVAGKSGSTEHAFDLVDFDEALSQLAELNERHARVVEMRLLGSMTISEIADELAVSTRTIDNDWNMARAWLSRELSNE